MQEVVKISCGAAIYYEKVYHKITIPAYSNVECGLHKFVVYKICKEGQLLCVRSNIRFLPLHIDFSILYIKYNFLYLMPKKDFTANGTNIDVFQRFVFIHICFICNQSVAISAQHQGLFVD
ncbi:unnamed protein product, partial [Meganyctiphanes norvegica]